MLYSVTILVDYGNTYRTSIVAECLYTSEPHPLARNALDVHPLDRNQRPAAAAPPVPAEPAMKTLCRRCSRKITAHRFCFVFWCILILFFLGRVLTIRRSELAYFSEWDLTVAAREHVSAEHTKSLKLECGVDNCVEKGYSHLHGWPVSQTPIASFNVTTVCCTDIKVSF